MEHRGKFVELIKERKYEVGAEIGVRYGYFSHYLVTETRIPWFAIDPWDINPELKDVNAYEIAHNLLTPLGVTLIKSRAEDVVDTFADSSLDFIYIDALHDYDSVIRDIRLWWPKLRKGGCIAGHDFSNAWPGVVQAVNEFADENKLEVLLTGIGDTYGESDHGQPSWYFFKE